MKNIKLSVLALSLVTAAVSASEAPKVEVKPGMFSRAYTSAKDCVKSVGTTISNNKCTSVAVAAAVAGVYVFRKEIVNGAKKLYNKAINNPGKTALIALGTAAVLGLEYKYGKIRAAGTVVCDKASAVASKVASWFTSSKVSNTEKLAAVKLAEKATEALTK
jgi:hypothetical protein